MPPDPKPQRRWWDPNAGKAKLEAEGRCRLCPSRRGLSRHHIVPKGQRGDDIDANLMPVCLACHELIHRNDQAIRENVRRHLRPEELAYVLERRGAGWLDKRYPVAHR